jgi:hypothetical protein
MPAQVVEEMTRLTEEVLADRLGKSLRLRDPDVRVIDPAMGTGTFPVHILERAAAQGAAEIGPGAATEAIIQSLTGSTASNSRPGPTQRLSRACPTSYAPTTPRFQTTG